MTDVSSTSLSDLELVELARKGDRPAFIELLARHDDDLRALAFRLLADRGAMETTLHDAYLRAHRGIDRVRPVNDVGTWLYRIVYNGCIDALRSSDPREASSAEVAAAPLGPTPTLSAAELVRAALAELPTSQRVAVVLMDGEGFDLDATAKILQVEPTKVAARLDRARVALRSSLGDVR